MREKVFCIKNHIIKMYLNKDTLYYTIKSYIITKKNRVDLMINISI